MTSKLASRRDLDFVLYELPDAQALSACSRVADRGRANSRAALDLAERVATDFFAFHNRRDDVQEQRFEGGRVRLVTEIGVAPKTFVKVGLMAAEHDDEYGGMPLPLTVAKARFACRRAANLRAAAHPFLTIAIANLLPARASAQQVGRHVAPQSLVAVSYARWPTFCAGRGRSRRGAACCWSRSTPPAWTCATNGFD